MPRQPTHNDPSDFESILSKTFVTHEHLALLQIGSRTWDRVALGLLGCPHPVAALKLNRVVQGLRIRSLEGLARAIHEVGNFKGCGITVYYIALAVLKSEGWDPEELHDNPVKYSTLKQRAQKIAKKGSTKRPRRAGPPSESADAGA